MKSGVGKNVAHVGRYLFFNKGICVFSLVNGYKLFLLKEMGINLF